MSRIRGKDTEPERIVRSTLHRAGYRFRLHSCNLPVIPTSFCLDVARLSLCTVFWHRHAGCRLAYSPKTRRQFWRQKFENTVRRDRRISRTLRDLGWKVVTVWSAKQGAHHSG